MNIKYFQYIYISMFLLFATGCSRTDHDSTPEGSDILVYEESFGDTQVRSSSFSYPAVHYGDVLSIAPGLFAEVSIREDFEPTLTPTKALSDGHYSILAFEGTTFLQKIDGDVQSNKFIPSAGTATPLSFPRTANNFICTKTADLSNISATGTITFKRADAELVSLSRVITQNLTDKNYFVFNLKHVGTGLRFKVSTGAGESLSCNLSYNTGVVVDTRDWEYNTAGGSMTDRSTITLSSQSITKTSPATGTIMGDYIYFLGGTNAGSVTLEIKDLQVAGRTLAPATITLNDLVLEAGKRYTAEVKIVESLDKIYLVQENRSDGVHDMSPYYCLIETTPASQLQRWDRSNTDVAKTTTPNVPYFDMPGNEVRWESLPAENKHTAANGSEWYKINTRSTEAQGRFYWISFVKIENKVYYVSGGNTAFDTYEEFNTAITLPQMSGEDVYFIASDVQGARYDILIRKRDAISGKRVILGFDMARVGSEDIVLQ